MKKMVIIIGAAMLAGVANAAAVQWNSGTFANGFKGPDGATLASSTAYTMIVSFYSDAAGTTLLTTSTATSARPNGAFTATTTYSDFAANTTYYASAIIKANDGSASWEAGTAAFAMPANGNTSINFTTGAGFADTSAKWASGGWETTAVPEPTTSPRYS